MEFKDVLARRRMVRNYTDEPVDREAVERIVRAAKRAPSAGYTQGQYLIVVTEADTRRAIADLSNEAEYVAEGFDPWISSAPVHVVVCVNEADYHRRYQEPDKVDEDGREIDWPIPYWWVDVGATMQNIWLAAVNEGLGCGFVGTDQIAALKAELGIPDEFTPIGVMPVGRPLPDVRSPSLKRGWVPFEQFAHWERWQ